MAYGGTGGAAALAEEKADPEAGNGSRTTSQTPHPGSGERGEVAESDVSAPIGESGQEGRGRTALVFPLLFMMGCIVGGGSVAAWALKERPVEVVGDAALEQESMRPESQEASLNQPRPAPVAPAEVDGGSAEADKILARMLRRAGNFEAAAVATTRYRQTRLATGR